MNRTVVIAGSNDAAGRRIAADLQRMGWQVIAIPLEAAGGKGPLYIDPYSHESAKEAAAAAAQMAPAIDMLVLNYDLVTAQDKNTILEPFDYDILMKSYEYNAIGPVRALNAFLPLLEKGQGKRICIVTTPESSNNACRDTRGYGRRMGGASLNMAANLVFNGLRPEGYTFRLYGRDPRAGEDTAGAFAAEYFTRNRSNEPEDYKHSDENRLVLRDWMGLEIPY